MLDQYLQYAIYLEQLPGDNRQEEVLSNQPQSTQATLKQASSKTATNSSKKNYTKTKGTQVAEETPLYKEKQNHHL
jgi:hypothetical protein